jgi:uncharacterized membrane protein
MKSLIIPALLAILVFSCTKSRPYRELKFDGQSVKISLTDIRERKPEFYSVLIDGKKVSFFIVMVNGKIQSYFNACRRCYPRKLGFDPAEGHMRCRACNAKYPLDQLKEGIADCSPIPLKGAEEKYTYIIARDAFLKGVRFF